ncbi:MAG: AAA family ATPase, partial [Clostridiales bacterium]|nr:AAA family ATPase [Clostridiales bacterium]
PFGFNEMADGYSAFLHIVIELMLRMENKASLTYDLPGIVLIDEIETHLHVKLQKKVLPFLTKMFPRIQFIVTTHSPFVITSLSDAVVYDLEKQISVEDMSAYSYEAVIEHYYDINMYSERADRQFETYKSLIAKENRSPEETEQLASAIAYLKQVPIGAAEEMVFAFREMEAQRRAKNGQNQ